MSTVANRSLLSTKFYLKPFPACDSRPSSRCSLSSICSKSSSESTESSSISIEEAKKSIEKAQKLYDSLQKKLINVMCAYHKHVAYFRKLKYRSSKIKQILCINEKEILDKLLKKIDLIENKILIAKANIDIAQLL